MQTIVLDTVRVYAYHGCLKEEALIGSEYLIDLEVSANLIPSALKDDLQRTVDYVQLYQIIQEEMQIRSKLIESVALRIKNRIHQEIPEIQESSVKITKLNPPIGGDVKQVSVIF